MIQILKKALGIQEGFSLPQDFEQHVRILAQGLRSEEVETQAKKVHYSFLNSSKKEQYKATTEYKFLSEHFNEVPDLLLRGRYRKEILNRK